MGGDVDYWLELGALLFVGVSVEVDVLVELLCLAVVDGVDLHEEVGPFGRVGDGVEVGKEVLLVVLLEGGLEFGEILHIV